MYNIRITRQNRHPRYQCERDDKELSTTAYYDSNTCVWTMTTTVSTLVVIVCLITIRICGLFPGPTHLSGHFEEVLVGLPSVTACLPEAAEHRLSHGTHVDHFTSNITLNLLVHGPGDGCKHVLDAVPDSGQNEVRSLLVPYVCVSQR